MAKRKIYQFGGITFPSKKAVIEYLRDIRLDHEGRGPISDPAAIRVLADLARCHVNAEQKVGAGIKGFFVAPAPDHPGTCFWIERVGGPPTELSIPKCLNAAAHANRRSFRMLVRPEIEAFKASKLAGSGETFTSELSGMGFPVDEAVADHYPETFEEVLEKFCVAEGIDIDEMLTSSLDCRSEPVWRDPELPKRFLAFHAGFGLRLVHFRENLSEIKRDTNARRKAGQRESPPQHGPT